MHFKSVFCISFFFTFSKTFIIFLAKKNKKNIADSLCYTEREWWQCTQVESSRAWIGSTTGRCASRSNAMANRQQSTVGYGVRRRRRQRRHSCTLILNKYWMCNQVCCLFAHLEKKKKKKIVKKHITKKTSNKMSINDDIAVNVPLLAQSNSNERSDDNKSWTCFSWRRFKRLIFPRRRKMTTRCF